MRAAHETTSVPVSCFLLALVPAFLVAQSPSQPPSFQAKANEVVVPVSVLNKSGKPVEDLTDGDFELLDNGRPQKVRVLTRDVLPLPIYAVIVLQTSGLSDAAIAKVRKTASLVGSYITNDMEIGTPSLAALVTASDEIAIHQDFTADANVLDDAFDKLRVGGDAGRVLDGVNTACDMLAARKQAARRLIIVIGESRDRGSKTHVQDVVAKAQRESITIYDLSYSGYKTAFTQKASEQNNSDDSGEYDPADHGGGVPFLQIAMELSRLAKVNIAEALTRYTGGVHAGFTRLSTLEDRLAALGNDIHSSYVLTFVPALNSPGYHSLSLTVRGHPEAAVHYRSGYWIPE